MKWMVASLVISMTHFEPMARNNLQSKMEVVIWFWGRNLNRYGSDILYSINVWLLNMDETIKFTFVFVHVIWIRIQIVNVNMLKFIHLLSPSKWFVEKWCACIKIWA